MKGIKKLFFGLSLMTIVGLAFHSEAKAATSITSSGYVPGTKSIDLEAILEDTASSGDSVDVEIKNTDDDITINTITFTHDGSNWSCADSGVIVEGNTAKIKISKSDIVSHMIGSPSDGDTTTMNLSYGISYTPDGGSLVPGTSDSDIIEAIYNPSAEVKGDYASGLKATINSGGWYFEGDSVKFRLEDKDSSGYLLNPHHAVSWCDDPAENSNTYETNWTPSGSYYVEYFYDDVLTASLNPDYSQIKINETKYVNLNIESTYNTWGDSSKVSLYLGDEKLVYSGGKFALKSSSIGTYELKIVADGLSDIGEVDESLYIKDIAVVSDGENDYIQIGQGSISMEKGSTHRVDIKKYSANGEEINYSTISFLDIPSDTYVSAKLVNGNKQIELYGKNAMHLPAEGVVLRLQGETVDGKPLISESFIIVVTAVDPGPTGIYYDLMPKKVIELIKDADSRKISFESLIINNRGFNKDEDDLQWILYDNCSNYVDIENEKAVNPTLYGKKKTPNDDYVYMYLQVKRGDEWFPKTVADIEARLIPIRVLAPEDPTYALIETEINVKVKKLGYLIYDDLIESINFDPDEATIEWKFASNHKTYIEVLNNGRDATIRGIKVGSTYAWLHIVTDRGEFNTNNPKEWYRLKINVYDGAEPTPTPVPTRTPTPGKELSVDDIDLTVGATDRLTTFIKDKVSSGAYTVDGVSLATVGNNGGSLNNVTLKAGNKTGREVGVVVKDDANNSTTTTLSVYPVCTATRDSSNVKFSVPGKANTGVAGSHITTTGAIIKATIGSTVLGKSGSSWSKDAVATESVSAGSANANDIELYTLSYPITDFLKGLSKEVLKASGGEKLTVTVSPYGTVYNSTSKAENTDVAASVDFAVYKISLGKEEGVTYKVDGTDVSDYFYAIEGVPYTITSTGKSGYVFDGWEGKESDTSTISNYKFSGSKTLRAIYKNNNSSSSSSSSSKPGSSTPGSSTNTPSNRGGGNDYDDVPRTGESKADIWILWSVLLASILGAGYMIYKRFGLVNAIASVEVDEVSTNEAEVTQTQDADKAKEDNLKMLRDLKDFK